MTLIDISGKKFGKLLVVSHVPIGSNGSKHSFWRCVCDCGKHCEVRVRTITETLYPSCGCTSQEYRKLSIKHGHASGNRTRTYRIWKAMRTRCSNPNVPCYHRYGGNGISVCERWEKSYENFLSDMGECPDGKSIDRINGKGNYEPGNCRWATPTEQARNTKSNRRITIEGETKLFSDWCQESGLPKGTFHYRSGKGFKTKKALFQPSKIGNNKLSAF